MAIEKNVDNSQYGISFNNAYFRIESVIVSRWPVPEETKHYVCIDIACFAVAPQEKNTKPLELKKLHVYFSEIESQNGSNFLEKCYAWVMTQPDMVGSSAV